MDFEQKFKEETGFDSYADNDLRPKVPSDYYVEWLEQQLITSGVVGRSEQLLALAKYMCQHQNNLDGKTAKDYLQDFLS